MVRDPTQRQLYTMGLFVYLALLLACTSNEDLLGRHQQYANRSSHLILFSSLRSVSLSVSLSFSLLSVLHLLCFSPRKRKGAKEKKGTIACVKMAKTKEVIMHLVYRTNNACWSAFVRFFLFQPPSFFPSLFFFLVSCLSSPLFFLLLSLLSSFPISVNSGVIDFHRHLYLFQRMSCSLGHCVCV